MSRPVSDPQSAEKILRKKLKSGKIKPTRSGTLVTGRLPGLHVYARAQCEGHVWLTHRARRQEGWQSGWAQSATCVVCDYTTAELDASWWIEKATRSYLKLTLRLVRAEHERLIEVRDYLKEQIESE